MSKYSKLAKQLFLFGIVGGASFLIDLGVTVFLYNIVHFPPYLAGTIGFLSAFFFNFPINRKHVFHHTHMDRFSLRTQIIFYISLSLFNLFVTGVLIQLLVGTGLLLIAYAKIVTTGLIAMWNFIIFKKFVFSKHNSESN